MQGRGQEKKRRESKEKRGETAKKGDQEPREPRERAKSQWRVQLNRFHRNEELEGRKSMNWRNLGSREGRE